MASPSWPVSRWQKRFAPITGISLITIRPRATLGAGRLGIFQVLFEWIKDNRNVYVIGSGNIKFQFIHAYDLIDFYMLAIDAGKCGTYNVGTDNFGTLRGDLEDLIRYVTPGSRSRVKSAPRRSPSTRFACCTLSKVCAAQFRGIT